MSSSPAGSIVLIGFMGSGKSSVARRLAHALQRKPIDLDSEIELHEGCTIAQLFEREGEAAFRAKETSALKRVLATDAVIATGGGIVTREENRETLAIARHNGCRTVYLRATPATLTERIRRQPGKRPLIDGDTVLSHDETRTRVMHLLIQRSPWYETCADVVIDTDGINLDEIVRAIVAKLEREGGS